MRDGLARPQPLRHSRVRERSEKCLCKNPAHRQQKNRKNKFHPLCGYCKRLGCRDEASRCCARNAADNFPAALRIARTAILFSGSALCRQIVRRLRRMRWIWKSEICISGEHRPPACSFRQLAGNVQTSVVCRLREASRQAAEMTGWQPVLPRTERVTRVPCRRRCGCRF